MAPYHLWHPSYVIAEPLTIEAFVTLGDSLLLSHGTDAFVRQALRAIGLDVRVQDWHLDAVRSHYFNSHREASSDWEDAWDLTWRLRVAIDAADPPDLPDPPRSGYFDLDASDGSFRPDDRPQQRDGWVCLLLADAPSTRIMKAAAAVIERRHPDADCLHGRAFNRYPQLRCEVGCFPRAWYEQGAAEAEETLAELKAVDASVRYHGLLN